MLSSEVFEVKLFMYLSLSVLCISCFHSPLFSYVVVTADRGFPQLVYIGETIICLKTVHRTEEQVADVITWRRHCTLQYNKHVSYRHSYNVSSRRALRTVIYQLSHDRHVGIAYTRFVRCYGL
jgi:hypothetical protein